MGDSMSTSSKIMGAWRRRLFGAAAVGAMMTAAPVWAQVQPFQVAAQPASSGIAEFARQAGVQILVAADEVRNKQTRTVQGDLPVRQALEGLLAGTNLVVVSDDGRTITLGPAPTSLIRTAWQGAAAPMPTTAPAAPLEATPASEIEVGEVVVTGSRLQVSGFQAPTPVTTVGAAEIEQRASASVFEIVRDIPSFRGSSGPSVNSTGAQNASKANLDLRGLGSQRTLVMMNGRRHVPDGQTGLFDTNLIPTSLIERVEIVTGGASAAYGSDAVAGVVNFILRNRMEGLDINLHYGVSQQGDNVEVNGATAYGTSFADGRGHFIIGGDFTLNNGSGLMDSREWGESYPGVMSLPANRPAGLPATIISNNVFTSAYNSNGLVPSGPLRGTAWNADGGVFQYQYGSIIGTTEMIGGTIDSWENPDQRLRPAYDRSAALARVEYELTPEIDAFAQLHYGNLLTYGQSFGARIPNYNNYPVLISNPFLPASVVAAMRTAGVDRIPYSATRRDDVGSIRSRNRTESLQADFGLDGEIFGDWSWDVGLGLGRATFNPNLSGTPRTADFFAAAYVVTGPDGKPACGPVATNPHYLAQRPDERAKWIANLSPGCVPYNIFGANVEQNKAALAYFNSASQQSNDLRQYTVQANLTGDILELPAGPVAIATGFEWRKDTADVNGCPDCKRGALMNQNYPTYTGEIEVKEAYLEGGVPLLRDLPLAQSLDLNGAIRRTNYSTSGSVTTWKVGATWEPVDALRLRFTRSRDIRAPNINELFNPGSEGNPNVVNRVTGRSGFTKSNTVGNNQLVPETADTTTVGLVFQPTWGWTTGFRASVDYYDIEIRDVIATLGVQEILDRLLVGGDQSFARFVELDPSSPIGVARVNVPQLNLNALKTNGVDIEMAYRAPLDTFNVPGDLTLRALGTWVDDLRTIAGVRDTDNAGATVPTWSWNGQATYNLGRVTANLMVRYTSPIKYNVNLVGPEDPNYNPAASNSVNKNVWPEAVYWNTSLRYQVVDQPGRQIQAYLNIDNLFDKDPPIVAISLGGSPYDLVGRAFKAGVRMTF